jgi:uncharacterized protein (TIGR03435 family)
MTAYIEEPMVTERLKILFGVGVCLFLSPQTRAQVEPRTQRHFEVSTIKPNPAGPPRIQTDPFQFLPNGRFTATNVTLVDVIVRVYGTRRIQMQGGPSCIDSDRFEIAAKADEADGNLKPDDFPVMVQSLLEDRFKLALHRETKEMPVYALVVGKNPPSAVDGRAWKSGKLRSK